MCMVNSKLCGPLRTFTVSASSTIDFFFAPVLGYNTGNTGAVRAAACRGFCGQASSPLDVVLVIDAPNDETISLLALGLGMGGNAKTETLKAFSTQAMDQILKGFP